MSRNIVNVFIAPELIAEWVTTTDALMFYSVKGVPVGSRMVNFAFDFERCLFCATMEHESFDPVPSGNVIPILNPELTRHHLSHHMVSIPPC